MPEVDSDCNLIAADKCEEGVAVDRDGGAMCNRQQKLFRGVDTVRGDTMWVSGVSKRQPASKRRLENATRGHFVCCTRGAEVGLWPVFRSERSSGAGKCGG
jgi:hypothetical protein